MQMTNTNQINPKVLQAARKKKRWTQEQLADRIGCAKDTVSRWERGQSRSVRSHLRNPLCKNLQIEWQELTDPDVDPETPDISTSLGWMKTKIQVMKDVRVALDLVAMRYDIHPHYVLRLAPLLFVIIAEQSLLWRKRRLDEIDSAFSDMEEKLPDALGHLGGIIFARSGSADERLFEEKNSLGQRDVFGFSFDYGHNWHEEDEGPFMHYIRELVKDLPEGAVASIKPCNDGNMIGSYEVAANTLENITGLSGNEDRCRRMINHIRLGMIDLKECMRFKRDNSESDYKQWLSDKLGQADEKISELLPVPRDTDISPDPDQLLEILGLIGSFWNKNSSVMGMGR